jgi:hypothetical protein
MRREPRLADMCRKINAGHEKLKRQLPIWTPSCAGFANNHRAVKDATKPLQRLMLDFDEKGHSLEILERSLLLQKEGKWEILLVEESVRKGTHVLITLPEGMTPQEAQQRFSMDVGFQADPALKDVARCIYMVPEEYTLYVSDALFEVSPQSTQSSTEFFSCHSLPSPCHPERSEGSVSTAQPSTSGCDQILRPAQNDINESPQNDKNKEEKEKNYPTTHEGIDYKDIINLTGYTQVRDDVAKVPYLINAEGKLVCTYEDAESIAEKCRFIHDNGLKGAMYWDYCIDDAKYTLRKAVAKVILNK